MATPTNAQLDKDDPDYSRPRHVHMRNRDWHAAAAKAQEDGYKISQVVRMLLRAYVDGRIELGVKTDR